MEGIDRMEKNKEPAFETFKKELIEAERFGIIAVRVTVITALDTWRMDYENLARMSDFMICQAHVANVHQDKELTGTYELHENLTGILANLNRQGRLGDLLSLLGLQHLLDVEPEPDGTFLKNGRIVVIGASEVSEKHLQGVAKSLGNMGELTQEKKEQLIRRVTEAAESGVLKMQDWAAIYDILLEACHREEIAIFEQYMVDSLKA